MKPEAIERKLDELIGILKAPAITKRLTAAEAAEYCKVSIQTIHRHKDGGKITFSQPGGSHGTVYFKLEDLEEYMNLGTVEAVEMVTVHKRIAS